jgi:endonuclease/exonuclease/phosphatase family metal-dependent hydrolase
MRILTYNIHGWKTTDGRPNLDGVARVIEQSGADIVGLNEVFYPRAVEGASGPALEALAARLGMHFVFGPCLRWPAQDDLPADAYGNALLSRWPILASAAHHLTPKEEDAKGVLAGKEQRGLLEARILLSGGERFTVYVTHLDHTDEEARLVQLRVARTWLGRDRHRPHLLMGDFNTLSPWDLENTPGVAERLQQRAKGGPMLGGEKGPRVVTQLEREGYVDLGRHFSTPGAQSFIPATDPPIRIDYLFASKVLAPHARACAIIQEPPGEEASDHRPVLAEIDWPAGV